MIEINDKYYHEDNFYNRNIYQEYEEDILEYINKYSIEDYDKILEIDKRTNIFHIFSKMRSNIIKWHNFEENKEILEIGANYGEITQELTRCAKKVTAIEFTRKKIEGISKRLENSQNLELILCSNLKNLEIEKYDYIVLIGIAEYAHKIGFKDLSEMINWAYDHLNENGKILLAVDNKFGAKYLAGSKKCKNDETYMTFKPYLKKDYKLYGKNELEKILQNNRFYKYKFYYPVPNYNITHLIYTDEYLPKQNSYNIYYDENENILFNELKLIDEANKNNQFDIFTNSYLIEIVKNNNLSDLKYANYTTIRKKEYKILTTILEGQVTKQAYQENEINHIKQISKNIEILQNVNIRTCEKYEDDKIKSEFIAQCTMDEYLKSLLKQNEPEKFGIEIEKWFQFLNNKFKVSNNIEDNIFDRYGVKIENKEKLTFLEDGLIDLVFQNAFYNESNYIIFDQEWYEKNTPLEFIMYRAIKHLFFQNEKLEKLYCKEDLYKKYNIFEYLSEFEELDEKWEKSITDENTLAFYSEKWKQLKTLEDIKNLYNKEISKVYEEKDEMQKSLQYMKEKNAKLEQEKDKIERELNEIKSSKLYKIYKYLKGNK